MANPENMRHLEAKGEMDYDHVNDILFFKLADREYDFSMEFQNMVIDVDSEQFLVGIQIFDASKFLGISKINLREIPKWQFRTKIENGIIELRLNYQIKIRNQIFDRSPIIIQDNKANLPSPQMAMTI